MLDMKTYKLKLDQETSDSLEAVSERLNITRSKVIATGISILNLASGTPNWTLAFLDESGKRIEPIQKILEPIEDR